MTENEVNIWSDRIPLLEKMRWWSTLMEMQWRRGISTALLIQSRGGARLQWRKTAASLAGDITPDAGGGRRLGSLECL